jgi:hypothetical protein
MEGTPDMLRVTTREKKTVAAMVRIYCADHHGSRDAVCDACRELLGYSHQRLDRCPYGDGKPTCKECPVHCYKPDRRVEMQEMMRYAGPKMLLRHPWLAVAHLWQERFRKVPSRPARRRVASSVTPPERPA